MKHVWTALKALYLLSVVTLAIGWLITQRRVFIYAVIGLIAAAVVVPLLLLLGLVVFAGGAERARRRRLRVRMKLLRQAVLAGREEEVARLLDRIVALRGMNESFLEEWLGRPSYPFRERLLKIVPSRALRHIIRRRDDPLAPRAWLEWARSEMPRGPGQILRQDVSDDELEPLWERWLREPTRLPSELLEKR